MNILAMPAYFWPQRGGIETITFSLAKEWIAKGHKVTVLTSKIPSQKRIEFIEGIKIIRTGKHSLFGCPMSPGAIFRIIKEKPDVVYLHYPHPLFLDTAVLGCIAAKVPYVLHVHGPEITYDDWKNIPISIYNKTLFKFAVKNATAIVSHTEAAVMSSKLLTKYKNKIKIIPHGTDLPPKGKENVLERHGLKNEKTALFIGILRDYKRVDLLLRAFVFVTHQISNAHLIIAGDGPMRKEWETLARELGLLGKVLFIGRVSDEDKWNYYKCCDLFVLPSPTLMESFGTVALEAASCKKTVIATGSGVAEVFKKESIGKVVEPYNVQALAECMIDLLLHPTKAKRIGERSEIVIRKKYLWENRAQEYINLFEKIRNGNSN